MRMVTRRFTLTSCEILAMNLATKEGFTTTVEVAGKFKKMDKLNKAIHSVFDNQEHVFVSLVSATIEKRLKGVPEDKFLADSVDIPEKHSERK